MSTKNQPTTTQMLIALKELISVNSPRDGLFGGSAGFCKVCKVDKYNLEDLNKNSDDLVLACDVCVFRNADNAIDKMDELIPYAKALDLME